MPRGRTGILLAAVAVAVGCAVPPQSSDRTACPALFQEYDRVERLFPQQVEDRRGGFNRFQPALSRWAVLLIQNDCQTRPRDLGGLDAVAIARAGRPIVETGPLLGRQVSVHVGALTSGGDASRAVALFTGIGLQSTSIGNPQLGRRVYAGPVRTEGGLRELLSLATEAGFVGSYPSQFWRF